MVSNHEDLTLVPIKVCSSVIFSLLLIHTKCFLDTYKGITQRKILFLTFETHQTICYVLITTNLMFKFNIVYLVLKIEEKNCLSLTLFMPFKLHGFVLSSMNCGFLSTNYGILSILVSYFKGFFFQVNFFVTYSLEVSQYSWNSKLSQVDRG